MDIEEAKKGRDQMRREVERLRIWNQSLREDYVEEIMKECAGATLERFNQMTVPDVNAGHAAEVAEARRRLFGKKA